MKQKSSTHSSIIRYAQAPFLEIRVTDQSDRVYESHAHPTLSIGAMREWKTLFRTPKGEFLLEEETLVVIEPHLQHSCNPYLGKKRSYVMVFIAYDYCVTLQQRLFKEASSLLPISTPLIFNKALFEEFMRIITALIQGYDVLHVKAFEAWFEHFLWLYTKQGEVKKSDATLEQIAFFLQNRFDEPLSLDELSKRFSMNPFVLTRKFKAHFGCTPKHYWLDMRIHHAKTLLAQGMPLSLCALHCGFVDQSHFHRFFKRRTALTPKEYQVNFIQ